MAIKSFSNIDFDSKGGVENSNETIDYSQSAESTLDTSKEDTLKGHLSYFAKGINWIKSQFSKYLPLAGGTMSGAIDMNKNPLKTAGFEVVTALPTTNLFVGRKVVMNGIEYTYNGNLWTSQLDPLQKYINNIDGINTPLTSLNAKSYELQLENGVISQIPQLLANNNISLTNNVLQSNEYIYERMDNGTTEWVESSNKTLSLGDKLRFTVWKNWETNVRGLSSKKTGNINCINIDINLRRYRMKVTIEYLTYTNTLGDADINNSANYTWWKVYEKEFPEQKTTWIFPLQRSIYSNSVEGGTDGKWYIHNVRITIESITAGTGASAYFTPSLYVYTTEKITPQNVPININYDAKIKPTQTTTIYKTNSWILQYLTQGVHWLRDNKVETNSDATLKKLTLSDNLVLSNGTTVPPKIVFQRNTATDDYYDYFIKALASGIYVGYNLYGDKVDYQIALFSSDGGITASKFIKSDGTSSQFLKADGSVDSTSYQPTISDLSTIRTNASNGNTAYGWGNHANAGYAKSQDIPTELPPIDNSVTNAKIANNSITNEKLVNRNIILNGTSIALGGVGLISGLVSANGYKCFLRIENDVLILSALTFDEYGSIVATEEIARYPLLTELPTIPNPTANATEITNLDNWFNVNINSYIIPEDLMYDLLSGKNSMSQMLLQLNDASCTLTSYNLDFIRKGVTMTTLISDLTTKEDYEVYVENDIDSITTSGICTLKFKIDNHNIIIECYKKV